MQRLLKVPTILQEQDENFAGIPSLSPQGACDTAGLRDVGLQTQLQKNTAAKDYPALTATATATAHIELVEVAPNLDQLTQLLGDRPYSLEDEEDEAAIDANGDQMEMDNMPTPSGTMGCDNTSICSKRPAGCFTTQELLLKVQASETELLSELQRLQAVQFDGFWRLIDQTYLGSLLEMLLVSAQEHGWSVQAIPLQQAVSVLRQSGYLPAVVRHCLEVFGQLVPVAQGQADAFDSSNTSYALNRQQVCLQYARKLLSERSVWPRAEFLAAWSQAVPEWCCPAEQMLLGEALVVQPDAAEGYSEPRIRHFPARLLPGSPQDRFAALFAAQPRWTREQLDPYLAGLRVPGQTVEQLLLKFARASQRSPSDPTIMFVAR
eukprot:gene9935-10090_t